MSHLLFLIFYILILPRQSRSWGAQTLLAAIFYLGITLCGGIYLGLWHQKLFLANWQSFHYQALLIIGLMRLFATPLLAWLEYGFLKIAYFIARQSEKILRQDFSLMHPLRPMIPGFAKIQNWKKFIKITDWPKNIKAWFKAKYSNSFFSNSVNVTLKNLWSDYKSLLALFIFAIALNPLAWVFIWQIDLVIDWGLKFPNAAYDVIDYHGPMIASMLQEGRLVFEEIPSVYAGFYPKSIQILHAWFIASTHNSHYLNLVQIPFLFLAMLGIYQMLKVWNVGLLARITATMAPLFFPVVIKQISSGYIDVSQASLFLTALCCFFIWVKEHKFIWLLASGIALGIFGGSKSQALVGVGLLGLITGTYMISVMKINWHRKFFQIASYSLIVLGLSALWPYENYKITGNPFYPVELDSSQFETKKKYKIREIKIDNIYGFQQTKDQGTVDPLLKSLQEEWIGVDDRFLGYDNSTLYGGAGLLPWLFLFPLALTALLFLNKGQHQQVFVTIVLLAGLMILLQPLSFRIRFILSSLFILIPMAGMALDLLPRFFQIGGFTLVLLSALWATKTANLDEQSYLRGRSLYTAERVFQFHKASKLDRNPKKLIDLGYSNHPATVKSAELIQKKYFNKPRKILVSQYFRWPSFYLWGSKLQHKVNFFFKPKKDFNKYRADVLIGTNADRKRYEKINKSWIKKIKPMMALTDGLQAYKIIRQ